MGGLINWENPLFKVARTSYNAGRAAANFTNQTYHQLTRAPRGANLYDATGWHRVSTRATVKRRGAKMAYRRIGKPGPRRGRRYMKRKRTYGRRGKTRFRSRRLRRTTSKTSYRRVAKIARRAVLEKKFDDANYAADDLVDDKTGVTPGAIPFFQTIPKGTGVDQRTGHEIFVSGIELTIDLEMKQAATNYDPMIQRFTLMLVKQNGVLGLNFADMFKEPTATRRSPYKKLVERPDTKNFEVMWRRNYNFNIMRLGSRDPGALTASLSVNRPAGVTKVRYHVYIPYKKKVSYKVGTDAEHPFTHYLYYWQNEKNWLNGSAATTNELKLTFVKVRTHFTG